MKTVTYLISLTVLLLAVGTFVPGCKKEGAPKSTPAGRDSGTMNRNTGSETGHDQGETSRQRDGGTSNMSREGKDSGGTAVQPKSPTTQRSDQYPEEKKGSGGSSGRNY
jgi:hypothetical protein